MKQVVIKEEVQTVDLDSIQFGKKCYGVIDEHEWKGWIQPDDYESTDVQFLSLKNGVVRGNQWDLFRGEYDEAMRKWLSDGRKIYEFDNEKELFKWLSE